MTQPWIHIILQEYSQLRNLDKRIPGPIMVTIIHVANIVASAANTTLAPINGLDFLSKNVDNQPMIYPSVYQRSLLSLWNNHRSEEPKERLTPFRLSSNYFNFVYCGQPQVEWENFSKVADGTADQKVWICLVISMITISAIVGRLHCKKNMVTMETLSTLLTPGFSGSIKNVKGSALFTMWALCALIIVTYFTGSFTSHMIKPSPDNRMTKMIHLTERNYTLLFYNRVRFHFFKRLVAEESEAYPNLMRLANHAVFVPKVDKFIEMMTSGKRVAAFGTWITALQTISRLRKFILHKEIKDKKCFVGKELAFPQNMYCAFTPPGSELLLKILIRVEEAGFPLIWRKMTHAIVITDLSATDSVNPILQDEERSEGSSLPLHGKVGRIFRMWCYCLGNCFVVFSVEVFYANLIRFFS